MPNEYLCWEIDNSLKIKFVHCNLTVYLKAENAKTSESPKIL